VSLWLCLNIVLLVLKELQHQNRRFRLFVRLYFHHHHHHHLN
jgi:hypothetical protein